MAYNLESLVKILEQIMHPDYQRRWTLDPSKKPEIDSLLNKARALKQHFGNSSPLICKEIQSLESRIRDAAYKAEDILESHLAKRVRSRGISFTFSSPSLKKVIGVFDSAEEEIKKMMDGGRDIPESSSQAAVATAAASSRTDPNPRKILVGLSQDSVQLKDRLTRQEAKLEIIPIVGMGGIGKTTLALNVYDDPLVVSHFDTRAWMTISQEYNVRLILLGLLERITGKLTDEMRKKQDDQLAVQVHKSLYGRRYLIVLDDMWDNKAWDDIRRFFPDDKNGCRIIVTTRELGVAYYAGSNSSHHQMHLLDGDDSWNLLREMVFAQENCPPELEAIGKRITNHCRGLPLAIHVIGGVLSQAIRTQESWMQVAKDVTAVVANNDEQFSQIFSLSYNHLPNNLKPCFLYMGAFPEDYEIRSSHLIRLWVAEGFLEPVSEKSLEETAEMSLKALVDRNLIFIRRQETKRIAKSYGMHDLLRDLCVRKASEDKFLHIKNGLVRKLPEDKLCVRRVSIHSSYASVELMSLVRSLIWVGARTWEERLPLVFFASRLLRVLDLLGVKLDKFPDGMLRLINLRYLALACTSSLYPSSISTLCNLQTVVLEYVSIYGSVEAILGLPQLRHIKFRETDQYFSRYGKSSVRHENLQTLSGVAVEDGFDGIIESVPNLKKLGIFFSHHFRVSHNIDLSCLHKLETLKCSYYLSPKTDSFYNFLIFPPTLKRLTFYRCSMPTEFLSNIGSLPNLEVLKLREIFLYSSTWEPTEGEFSRLQFLLLEQLNLVRWEADETHFPRLERLVIRHCDELEEIPSRIGEILTLEMIEVHECSPSAVASARKIHEEQLEFGNYGLQVVISGSSK